ncbi:MAG: glycoside hydrolase family 1 protein [Lewinellaceae bacterium]|nr:glycoside hydrolase family 1 protein [Phaeodactylibacter sp.]MCB9349275.1 glycoside hydrolase family 1 protein [Lewinellaceae bacterium]
MRLKFPEGFFWGTSTSATQVETASAHNWRGFQSRDGHILDQTTRHEELRELDAGFILQFGAVYRCSVDWARLQPQPFAPFVEDVVEEYRHFFRLLNTGGTRILFVMHHFTNPLWFEDRGGWLNEDNISAFVDYARQCIENFEPYVFNWNTFNEPNVYALNAYLLGFFPPHKRSFFKANRVLRHLKQAHEVVYDLLKAQCPEKPVSISLNTGNFEGTNWLGKIPAKITDWWFISRAARHFEKVDYWGLSYYAHVPFTPFPITEIENPGKLDEMGVPHDNMWGYKPEGLGKILRRFHKRYGKPIIMAESGICTDAPQRRIQAIKDYLQVCHRAIQEGVDLRGFIHWSTWDNFEWNLGPTYRFGLVRIDLKTMEREMTEAGAFFAEVAKENAVSL